MRTRVLAVVAVCLASAGCGEEPVVWERAGQPVETDVIQSYRGSEAGCHHEDVIYLSVDWPVDTIVGRPRQFVRDPDGDLREVTVTDFRADASLPADARDSGYSSSLGELWFAPSDEDSVAYVVSEGGDQVEAWPRTKYAIGCD